MSIIGLTPLILFSNLRIWQQASSFLMRLIASTVAIVTEESTGHSDQRSSRVWRFGVLGSEYLFPIFGQTVHSLGYLVLHAQKLCVCRCHPVVV